MVGPKTLMYLHKFRHDINNCQPNSQICTIIFRQVGGMELLVTWRRAMKPSIPVVVTRMVTILIDPK
jgi:hypothetical protein